MPAPGAARADGALALLLAGCATEPQGAPCPDVDGSYRDDGDGAGWSLSSLLIRHSLESASDERRIAREVRLRSLGTEGLKVEAIRGSRTVALAKLVPARDYRCTVDGVQLLPTFTSSVVLPPLIDQTRESTVFLRLAPSRELKGTIERRTTIALPAGTGVTSAAVSDQVRWLRTK